MSTGNSENRKKTDERLSLHLRLLNEADTGHLEDLECPKCRQPAVSVWFTHPAADDFQTRAHDAGKPRFFSEDRVSADLQERDSLDSEIGDFQETAAAINVGLELD